MCYLDFSIQDLRINSTKKIYNQQKLNSMRKCLLVTALLFGINCFGQETNPVLNQATTDFKKLEIQVQVKTNLFFLDSKPLIFNSLSNTEAFYQLQFGNRFSIGISLVKVKTQ